MDKFEKERDFIGDISMENMRHAYDEFLAQAREIRKRLGKQAYLFDKYLEYLMESTNSTLAYEASTDGFDKALKLREICMDVVLKKEKNTNHPFFWNAKAFIEAHPLDCMENQTKVALYVAMLSNDFLEFEAKTYCEEQKSELSEVLDIIDLRNLFEKICGLLWSEDEMHNINRLFCQRFQVITPMAGYLQGLANNLLDELTYRDRETSKFVFQLLLDSKM
jgi:hypothetical protein